MARRHGPSMSRLAVDNFRNGEHLQAAMTSEGQNAYHMAVADCRISGRRSELTGGNAPASYAVTLMQKAAPPEMTSTEHIQAALDAVCHVKSARDRASQEGWGCALPRWPRTHRRRASRVCGSARDQGTRTRCTFHVVIVSLIGRRDRQLMQPNQCMPVLVCPEYAMALQDRVSTRRFHCHCEHDCRGACLLGREQRRG